MAKATPKPKTVQPNLAKFITQTMPIFRQTVRNLRNYGVDSEDLHDEIEVLFGR